MSIKRCLSRLNDSAPFLSIALVLICTGWFRHNPTQVASFGPEQVAVARAVEAAPYRIGAWVGRDTRVPEAAVRLLKPNAMLSRRYTNLETNITVDLVIVHCGDARDMLGHYPPVCYPNAGWIPDGPDQRPATSREQGEPIALTMREMMFNASQYEFSRLVGWSQQQQIRIFNFFVLPDGTITSNINDVSKRTQWLGASIHGVAQIQLITDLRVPDEAAQSAATELLEGMEDLMASLGVFRHE